MENNTENGITKKPIVFLTFEEWIADQVKAMAPHAKTIKPIGVYFATCGIDDVNVDFNRKIADYRNHHFTNKSLADFYGAFYCAFNSEYGITLVFDSYDKVVDKDGFWKPKKRG